MHLLSDAQQLIANEAWGAMNVCNEFFVRPSNPIPDY